MSEARDKRLNYFQKELSFLREGGKQFAAQFPKIAGRLELGQEQGTDPHTERMIESFAFLTGQIRQDIDEERERLASMLLDTIYPHLLMPLPALSVVRFIPLKASPPALPLNIERGYMLVTQSFDGAKCYFQTCYDVDLLPLRITDTGFDDTDVTQGPKINLRFQRSDQQNVPVADRPPLIIDKVRLYLGGDKQNAASIYEMLFCHFRNALVQCDDGFRKDCALSIEPVGFSDDESVLPYPAHAHQGARLLQEYFTFPEKFLFVDLQFTEPLVIQDRFDLDLIFHENHVAPPRVQGDSFQLGCTPAINLFPKISEPIRTNSERAEYPIVADQFRNQTMCVHSVLSVYSSEKDGPNQLRPYLAQPAREQEYNNDLCWLTHRKPPHSGQGIGSLTLSLMNRNLQDDLSIDSTLYARILCTNVRLPDGLRAGDTLFSESHLPGIEIKLCQRPSRQIAPPQSKRRQMLVSALSLNHLSIVSGEQGLMALKSLLGLYTGGDQQGQYMQIDGIDKLQSRPITARLNDHGLPRFCRGIEIELVFNLDKFAGSSAFLLASVLDRFFPMYASINTCTRLITRESRNGKILKKWTPRCGTEALL